MHVVGPITLALAGLGGLFAPGHTAGAGAEPPAPVIRYTVMANHPVDPALWLPVAPHIALWADGRFVALDPERRLGDWLLPQLVEGHVDPITVAGLVARAGADGLLTDGGDYGPMLDDGPHAPLTELVISDVDATWVHQAFGLHLDASETGDRRVLADFVGGVVSLPVADTAEVSPWVPDAIAMRAAPVAVGDSEGDAVEWPQSGPPLRDGADCLVVRHPASIAVARDAPASTRFVDDGQQWRVSARPVLPGIPPC